MFAKIRVWNQALCVFVIFCFLIAQSGTLFSYQRQPAQKTDKVLKTPTGISGVLNDPNGKPIENGLLLVTNEELDILYGEAISSEKPLGKFQITEVPSGKELYVYSFHPEFPGAIDFQKVYLRDGQLKEVKVDVDKQLLELDQANKMFPNGRIDFYQKIISLLSQSESKPIATRIIDQLNMAQRIKEPTQANQQLENSKEEEEISTVSLEKEQSIKAKKKKFPWLPVLIGVGAITVAVVVMLLSKKKDSSDDTDDIVIPNGPTFEMIPIPGGTYEMGSDSPDMYNRPQHTVTISSFLMSKYEVTQELWQAVMGSNPSNFLNGGKYPVEKVSWNDAQAFIQKLNTLTGKQYRLPTDAEWEYACRAGTTGVRYGSLDAIAWNDSNSGGTTHPVGQKLPNAFGLYDTIGNVMEWCRDLLYDTSEPQTDPVGNESSNETAIRGGCYSDGDHFCTASVFVPLQKYSKTDRVGFRLAREY